MQRNSKLQTGVPSPEITRKDYPDNFQVNFDFIDTSSNFIWPTNPADSYLLSCWLFALSQNRNLQELITFIPEGLSSSPFHIISRNEFSPSAQSRIKKLQELETFVDLVDYDIYTFRYCFEDDATERLLGIIRDNVLYVLWWDINHRSYGDPRKMQNRKHCSRKDCFHDSAEKFTDYAYENDRSGRRN